MKHEILIVDDERDIRELLADTLKDSGYTTRLAKDSEEALGALAERVPSAVVLDVWLENSPLDGIGILETIRKKYEFLPVIMISGHGTVESALTSVRMGAYDFIEKPFKEDRLLHLLARAIESSQLKRENAELRVKAAEEVHLIGKSQIVAQLKSTVEKIAPTNSRIFITGPAGSGKEVVARLLHQRSLRKGQPFVVLNAASLSEDKADAELFGTEDSSDITAGPRKIGILERAQGGTLFIDEVTDLPLATQGKLLRVLQDQVFERIGSGKQIKVDVRVIVASTRDVVGEIRQGKFREDLYYRLNVVPLKVPALRERRDDIPLVSEYFLKRYAEQNGVPKRRLAEDALAAMQAYDWPGNVRQLKNMIEWLLIMAPTNPDAPLTSHMLPQEVFQSSTLSGLSNIDANIISMPLRDAREVFEKHYLSSQVNRFGGNISKTASFVGMERSALHRKLKMLGIKAEDKIEA